MLEDHKRKKQEITHLINYTADEGEKIVVRVRQTVSILVPHVSLYNFVEIKGFRISFHLAELAKCQTFSPKIWIQALTSAATFCAANIYTYTVSITKVWFC